MASSLIPALTVTTPAADTSPTPVTDGEQSGLLQALAKIPDPRDPRGVRYPLAGLLTVAVCAVLAGASSFAAITDWLHDLDDSARARVGLGRVVPAGTTVWRLLIRLDAGLLTTVLAGWLRARAQPVVPRRRRYRVVIAVDGKTLRGARRADGSQVHLLSALDTSTGPAVIATLRNAAIGYHRTNGETNIARATRRSNRRPHDLIAAVTSSNPTTQ
jgi:DDE_Tnp_1-associated